MWLSAANLVCPLTVHTMQASHQKTVTQEKFVSMANDLVSVWSGKEMQQMKEACGGPTTEPLAVCQNFDAFASMDETHIKAYLPPAIYRACLKVKNHPHLACKSVAGPLDVSLQVVEGHGSIHTTPALEQVCGSLCIK